MRMRVMNRQHILICLLFIAGCACTFFYMRHISTEQYTIDVVAKGGQAIYPTVESSVVARTKQSFDALVARTQSGFEPTVIEVSKGSVIRFVNKSSHIMSLREAGTEKRSVLQAADICEEVASGGYCELLFDAGGMWEDFGDASRSYISVIVRP